MAGNLSVSVTADITPLTSQMAVAQASVKQYGAAVRAAAAEISTANPATADQVQGLEKAVASYNSARAAAATFRAEMAQGAAATKVEGAALNEATTAVHSHRAATEAMVLVHEAMSGRFTKMGGSLMILSQQLGGTSLAMMGLTGAFAVAAMGAMHLVEWLDKVHDAKLLAEAGAVGSGLTQQQADQAEATLRSLAGVTAKQSGQIAHAYTSMRGITEPVLQELIQVTHDYALRAGEDSTAAAQKIVAAYSLDATAATEVMEKTRASTEATAALQTAITNNDPIAARTILLKQLAQSAHEVETQTRLAAEAQNRGLTSSVMALGPDAPPQAAQQMADASGMESDAAAATTLKAALAAVNAEMKTPAALSWSEQMRTSLSAATLATVEAGQKEKETWQQINQDKLKTEVEFWQKAVQATRAGSKEQEEAKRSLYQAEEQLDMMSQKQGVASAKEGLAAKLATLSAEQAAQRDNFTAVMAIENQKLAMLKAAGSSYTKQYQEELKHQEELARAHAGELQRIDLDGILKTEQIDKEAVSTKKSDLDAEVSDHLMTKQTEIAQLQAFVEQQYQTEHTALQNFLDNNTLEVAERAKALGQMQMLEAQHAKEVAALNAQMAQADRQTAQASERQWQQAFSSIGSTGEHAIASLITGQETFQRAELQVANSVVQSAISLGTKLVEQWAATELAKTFATDSGVAQRVAVQQAAGNSGLGAILAHWVGLETSKTAATTTGVATRTAVDQTQTTQAIAGQGAQTAAVITSEAAQTSAVGAGAAAQTAAQGAAGGSMVMADAAKAASGAYASASQVPYVGWILGPIAAAGAFTAVAAYEGMASLDTGTPSVPADMVAQIHQGEMIIPAFESSMLRSGQASLGGGGSSAGTSGGQAGGGGTAVSINLSAIDTQSGIAFLRSNSTAIAQMVAAQVSRNPSLRPSY